MKLALSFLCSLGLFASVALAQGSGNTARPGGKLPKDVSVQLVEVATGFVDPIHVTSAPDAA